MIKENRRFWKLLLFTIPTFGIYSIVFWFQFTKDLNEMNREDKRIKNYILVCFLSLITLGIYRWVWFFYLADRVQVTGERMGMRIRPGAGTLLTLKTYGTFILVGPFLANYAIIQNMNRVAKTYNQNIRKKTKVLSESTNVAAKARQTATAQAAATQTGKDTILLPTGQTTRKPQTTGQAPKQTLSQDDELIPF